MPVRSKQAERAYIGHGRLVNGWSVSSVCSGSVFPQELILNNFSGSFFGSFCPILKGLSFVFNHFSGSFWQKRIFLSHFPRVPRTKYQ